MISNEAVEAAAQVTFEGLHDDEDWEDVTPAERVPYLRQARAALEAAAPHLLQSAKDEATWEEGYFASAYANPYRSQA